MNCLASGTSETLTSTFIRQVLPWDRTQGNTRLNLHWTVSGAGARVAWRGASFQSANELLLKLNRLRTAETTRDIYVCMSAQAHRDDGSSAKAYVRSAATSVYFAGLWLDIDVKAGAYASTQEASAALGDFLKATSLPKPSLLVKSGGGGLHVHWLFSEVVERAVWEPLAGALATAAREDGLEADLACTTDPCRLLRIPDTLNHKYSPPRPVRMEGHVGPRTSAEEWHERLSRWRGSPSPKSLAGLFLDPDAGQRLSRVFITSEVNEELGAGIPEALPHWFDELGAVAKGEVITCALSHIDNTTTDPRERWLHVLFAVADAGSRGCTNARELALNWSRAGISWTSEDDFEKAWESASPGRPGGISVGTLLRMARAAGANFAPWQKAAEVGPSTNATLSTPQGGALSPPAVLRGAVKASSLPLIPQKRKWLHGTDLARGAVSLLVAPGGRGKSSWLIALALACASGRGLLDSHVFGGPLRVLYFNAEDGIDEVTIRLRAAMQRHSLTDADVPDLYVAGADNLTISLIKVERGTPSLDVNGWQVLIAEVARCRPDILILDPLVALVGGASLNDNAAAALMMRQLVSLAASNNLAVMIAHHTAKAREVSSAEAAMGAASIVNLARISLAVEGLNEGDAAKLGVAPWDAGTIFRVLGTKQNLSRANSSDRWFQIVSVTIANAEPPVYPNGDAVGVVEVFKPSPAGAAFEQVILAAAVAAIGGATSPLSPSAKSAEYAVPVVAQAIAPHRNGRVSDSEAKSIIDYLVRMGRIALTAIAVKRQGRGNYTRQGYIVVSPLPTSTTPSAITQSAGGPQVCDASHANPTSRSSKVPTP